MEWTIEVTGTGVEKPTAFTFEQLARMETTRLENVLLQMTHSPDAMTSWEGPTLDSLLEVARVKSGPMTFTLEAIDGYTMECQRGDMDSAVIARKDGQGRWLVELDAAAPVRLVPPHKTGDYWIRNLHRIAVEPTSNSEPVR